VGASSEFFLTFSPTARIDQDTAGCLDRRGNHVVATEALMGICQTRIDTRVNADFSRPRPLLIELFTTDKKEPRAMYADIVQLLPSNGSHADNLTGTEQRIQGFHPSDRAAIDYSGQWLIGSRLYVVCHRMVGPRSN
jgi:hypothetical protein